MLAGCLGSRASCSGTVGPCIGPSGDSPSGMARIGRNQTAPVGASLVEDAEDADVWRLSHPCAWCWGKVRPDLRDANNNRRQVVSSYCPIHLRIGYKKTCCGIRQPGGYFGSG